MGLHLLFDAALFLIAMHTMAAKEDKSAKDAERSQTPMIRLPTDSRVYC